LPPGERFRTTIKKLHVVVDVILPGRWRSTIGRVVPSFHFTVDVFVVVEVALVIVGAKVTRHEPVVQARRDRDRRRVARGRHPRWSPKTTTTTTREEELRPVGALFVVVVVDDANVAAAR